MYATKPFYKILISDSTINPCVHAVDAAICTYLHTSVDMGI